MSEADQENDDIDVADFLRLNSELFVILGVFSALAIYISDLGGGSVADATNEIRVGFGGALLLSTLLVLLIYKKLVERTGSVGALFRAHTTFQNWDLIVFTGGIILLLPALVTPILQQQVSLYFVIGVLTILVLIAVVFRGMLLIQQSLPDDEIQKNLILIGLSIISFYIGDEYMLYIQSNPDLYGVGPFSTSNLAPVFYDSLAAITVAISFGSVLVVVYATLRLADLIGDRYRQSKSE